MRANFLCILAVICGVLSANSSRKLTRNEYIDTYKDIAMREMERSKIPASITLAQGILESGNGNSTLARKANNHFGIKCHDWKGKSVKHDDDARNECFRKYKTVEESFHDHSEFLTGRSRYADLFTLEVTDYKGWAKGLKKAGYATSPTYADALIRIIEANNLQQYDTEVLARSGQHFKGQPEYNKTHYAGGRKILFRNRVKYVLAREGDTFHDLSEEMDLFQWQLPKYNDLPENHSFAEGDVIYLQPKRSKAEAGKKSHRVQEGESLHSISQRYAVRLDKLAARNQMATTAFPEAGAKILLRGRVKATQMAATSTPTPDTEKKSLQKTTPSPSTAAEQDDFQVEFDPDI